MKVHEYGENAVLAELDEPRLVPAVRAALAAAPGVVDAVAGARTVLVVFRPHARHQVLAGLERGEFTADDTAQHRDPVHLPVTYDGSDLSAVAELTGLSTSDVIALHSAAEYTVRFCGFAPGFAYLDGLDPRLRVPRRPEPRTAVPAGSVAVAGEFAGVYPRSSPGGWQLLGRTPAALWDVGRTPPALLAPGTRVRFVPS